MTRESNLRDQARKRHYSFAQHGKFSTGGLQGHHILKRSAGMELWKPSWEGTLTTIRIHPALSPVEEGRWDPWRLSTDDEDFGD